MLFIPSAEKVTELFQQERQIKMSAKHTYTINKLPVDKTDWQRVNKLSEKEINEAALADADAQPLSKKQLSKFKRVHPPQEVNVKAIRRRLHLSQAVFAAYFGINIRTLQEWEQGRRHPEGAARTLLAVIKHSPLAVQHALIHEKH